MKVYDLNIALSQPEVVTALYLSNRNFDPFPSVIFSFKNLEVLDLSFCRIRELPAEIASFAQLHTLVLDNNLLSRIPDSIGQLPLRVLSLAANRFADVPPVIAQMTALRELSLANNLLIALPDALFLLKDLTRLDISGNLLSVLPPSIKRLRELKQLRLGNNQISAFPSALFQCKKLEELRLEENQLRKIPAGIGKMEALENLDLSNNKLRSLPVEMGHCQNLRRLLLNNNELRKFPEFQSPLKHLILLEAGYNQLSRLPEWLGHCTRLEDLDLSGNRFRKLPEFLVALRRLSLLDISANSISKWPVLPLGLITLKLRDNPLTSVPASIGQLSALRELILDQTKLQRLPAEMSKLQELLALSGKGVCLKTLPQCLLSLPQIQYFEGFLEDHLAKAIERLWRISREAFLAVNLRRPLYDAFLGQAGALSKVSTSALFRLLHFEDLVFIIRKELIRRSEEQPNQSLQAGSVLYCAGRSLFNHTELQARVTRQGIGFAARPNAKITHVLLGEAPDYHPALAKKNLIFINERVLTCFLDQAEKRPLVVDASPEELENLRQLLFHDDLVNVEIALRLMQTGGVPKAFWHELMAIFLARWPGLPDALRDMVRTLLLLNLPESDKELLYLRPTLSALHELFGGRQDETANGMKNQLRDSVFDVKRISKILKENLGMPEINL